AGKPRKSRSEGPKEAPSPQVRDPEIVRAKLGEGECVVPAGVLLEEREGESAIRQAGGPQETGFRPRSQTRHDVAFEGEIRSCFRPSQPWLRASSTGVWAP